MGGGAYGVVLVSGREPSTSESMKGRVFLVFKFFCVEFAAADKRR